MIQVESSTTSYSEDQLERLAAFAEVAEILIGRELLRLHADREGLDVHLVGSSTALLAMERDLRRVAASNAPVLIAGERGSGKELAAYAVHYYSARREGPFVALNSAALSETLFADELFGHHRGAFTGASHPRQGALLAARGGTLFLDEIGDMTPRVQAALLRFLEAGELRQVGSDRPVRADVRIVAATNKDLSRLVEEGSFRADVLDRLDVFRLRVPPLSARKSDLELLVTHLMKRVCAETGRKGSLSDSLCARCGRASTVPCVGSGFVSALERVELEGNVRELGNLVTRLAVLHPQETLQAEHVERRSRMAADSPALPADPRLDSVIRSHIERVLEQQDYNKSATARVLGLPLSTLIHKMKRLGLES